VLQRPASGPRAMRSGPHLGGMRRHCIARRSRLRTAPSAAAGAAGRGGQDLGASFSADEIAELAKAIAREVVHELAAFAKPPSVVPANDARTVFEAGPIVVDIKRHEVRVAGRETALKPREFALITALARNAGQVLSRETLLELACPDDVALNLENNRSVDVHIRRLRIALGDKRGMIQTISGLGYKLLDR